MTTSALYEEQHRAGLARASIDDAQAYLRTVLDLDLHSFVVEFVHWQGARIW
jgi:hypothetical protein